MPLAGRKWAGAFAAAAAAAAKEWKKKKKTGAEIFLQFDSLSLWVDGKELCTLPCTIPPCWPQKGGKKKEQAVLAKASAEPSVLP